MSPVEENDRMRKTRDVFKKIIDIKGIFHAKMGSIKDRNGLYLTEAEDTKKRWQEYTEEHGVTLNILYNNYTHMFAFGLLKFKKWEKEI